MLSIMQPEALLLHKEGRDDIGGRARRLEIKPPNIAIYDRERDGDVTEAFLKVNGYIKKGSDPGI